jgi:hypothetical protein
MDGAGHKNAAAKWRIGNVAAPYFAIPPKFIKPARMAAEGARMVLKKFSRDRKRWLGHGVALGETTESS